MGTTNKGNGVLRDTARQYRPGVNPRLAGGCRLAPVGTIILASRLTDPAALGVGAGNRLRKNPASRLPRGVIEESVGIEDIVAKILEEITVNSVRTRLGFKSYGAHRAAGAGR